MKDNGSPRLDYPLFLTSMIRALRPFCREHRDRWDEWDRLTTLALGAPDVLSGVSPKSGDTTH